MMKPTWKVVLSPQEQAKAQIRAARFGTYTDEERTKSRAARFGTYNRDLESDKASKRRERFATAGEGYGKIGSMEATAEEKEKRKLRAARFGVPCASIDEERRKQRAQRFGMDGGIAVMNRHLTATDGSAAQIVSDEGIEAINNDREEGLIDEK